MSRLIVVGASAGGIAALRRLAEGLAAGLPASVLVVLHVGTHPSILPELMSASGPLPAAHAEDGQMLTMGRIYIAPPDHHMLVNGDSIRLTRGPKEHHTRPAIDPLFLSAALAHGDRVIGVVLSGLLDDGTFGLQAIKQCGGTAVVQDPAEAAEPSMPLSALANVEVDHCVGLAGMGALLTSLASAGPASTAMVDDERLRHEQALSLLEGDAMEHLSAVARPSPFVCPDCQGGLWEMNDSKPVRYRCHTGHAFTVRTLQHALWTAADNTVWAALRALQEKRLLLEHMAMLAGASGEEPEASRFKSVARAIEAQARQLRIVLDQAPDPVE